jgi:hypothetical protein
LRKITIRKFIEIILKPPFTTKSTAAVDGGGARKYLGFIACSMTQYGAYWM